MSFPKLLRGIAAFAVALAAAILLTRYYSTPEPPKPANDPPNAPSPAPTVEGTPPTAATPNANRVAAQHVSFKPQMVTLDLGAARSHTTLTVERDPARPAPERLWVRTYFFSTETKGKIWSADAVEIRNPFATGSRATVNASAACTWCSDRNAPRAGFYARVLVSTESAEATRFADGKVDTNISTATPVVVQDGSRAGR